MTGFFRIVQDDGTIVCGFVDKFDVNWEDRLAEAICNIEQERLEFEQVHDEECRRYEPSRSEFRCRSRHLQLGYRANNVPANALRL